ncbi:MAG: VOC family protein [Chloroflexota bacterium]|nr:VOC family protein [Anaerolineae bacterium]
MDMKLEVVPVPVSDIDRAKAFYVEKVGFNLDFDIQAGEMRLVQLTPPGSGCSVLLSKGNGEISDMQAGLLKGLTLVVKDIREAYNALANKGVAMGEIIEYDRGIKMVRFEDPDGNSWFFQEIPPGV